MVAFEPDAFDQANGTIAAKSMLQSPPHTHTHTRLTVMAATSALKQQWVQAPCLEMLADLQLALLQAGFLEQREDLGTANEQPSRGVGDD
jgi:hypothetical protein